MYHVEHYCMLSHPEKKSIGCLEGDCVGQWRGVTRLRGKVYEGQNRASKAEAVRVICK